MFESKVLYYKIYLILSIIRIFDEINSLSSLKLDLL